MQKHKVWGGSVSGLFIEGVFSSGFPLPMVYTLRRERTLCLQLTQTIITVTEAIGRAVAMNMLQIIPTQPYRCPLRSNRVNEMMKYSIRFT